MPWFRGYQCLLLTRTCSEASYTGSCKQPCCSSFGCLANPQNSLCVHAQQGATQFQTSFLQLLCATSTTLCLHPTDCHNTSQLHRPPHPPCCCPVCPPACLDAPCLQGPHILLSIIIVLIQTGVDAHLATATTRAGTVEQTMHTRRHKGLIRSVAHMEWCSSQGSTCLWALAASGAAAAPAVRLQQPVRLHLLTAACNWASILHSFMVALGRVTKSLSGQL